MDIKEIIKELNQNEILGSEIIEYKPLTGGTVSELFLLHTKDENHYVVKSNEPKITQSEADYLKSYAELELLPNFHFVEPSNSYLVYSFIEGSTNYVRNSKQELLVRLVQELINHYKTVPDKNGWGWADETTDSWYSFLLNRTIDAKNVLKSYLDEEDHHLVSNLVQKVKDLEVQPYLLHGDLGVHNFIFHNGQLIGVIDPTPVIGDPLYDLIYAFCSSPDDLTQQTIEAAARVLTVDGIQVNSNLYENVLIGLYHRLATCVKHHPDDLKEYLNAWYEWKNLI
ncbi:phosphotransferase [Fictibacillus sp. b24]|uniref:fructosamine kinase family protein n=1 Tax=Fictibacillus sp. b24 TaxID=3055863 RepID=UPI0025A15B40|nr:phosphotransferase [Fictibacillus sp. b24]MDM5317182.1 phosphotransferase [Fictibacillus sp. b24]